MTALYSKFIFNKFCLILVFLLFVQSLFSQSSDSTKVVSQFSGTISITNNGISLIPSFSLGKPATIFNLSIGKKKLTFEPEMRFALEGKPWSFLFWWRYKAILNDKFSLRIGAHPALNFRTIPFVTNGNSKDVIETRRFLAGEISPSYALTKNIRIGMYYLYSRGFDDSQKNAHFLVINSAFPKIKLFNDFHLGLFPNVYYLKLDDIDGFYASSKFRLTKGNAPFFIEAITSKIIKSEISPDRDFVWNISLVYGFNKKYVDFEPKI